MDRQAEGEAMTAQVEFVGTPNVERAARLLMQLEAERCGLEVVRFYKEEEDGNERDHQDRR